MAVILGTAGHIDHGKTTLVRALTGIDCDRLGEEKKRGITIELGFAWLDLACGERVGIVDVPGHEKFVRNMVAGAAGMDLVMLVIAADEGVMPQTREHLEICDLLGVKSGFVALTKCDLVDNEWKDLVKGDIHAALHNSFLANCPIIEVSAKTGAGLDDLKEYLNKSVQNLQKNLRSDIFRLPIDRVFTIKGHGTVVTGTVLSGHLNVGANVCIMPQGTLTRARSLERHGENVEEILPGSRCAINLQGLETRDLERGQIICKPQELFASNHWYTHLFMLPSSPFQLKNRTELHFHHGTKEVPARVILRGKQQLEPGASCFCDLIFQQPMCGIFGDHGVLRSGAPLRTIAGCQILSPLPPPSHSKRNKDQALIERYLELPALYTEALTKTSAQKAIFVDEVLALTYIPGASFAELKVLTNLPSKTLEQALSILVSQGKCVLWDRDTKSYLHATHFNTLQEQLLKRAQDLHAQAPLKQTFAAQALWANFRQDLPAKLQHKLLEQTLKGQKLLQEGEGLRLATHNVILKAEQEDLAQKILNAFRKASYTPPNIKELLSQLGSDEKRAANILKVLVDEGKIIRVKEGVYYASEALNEILEKVKAWFEQHDNLDIAALKGLLGLSRKYLVILLEYMDNAHITVRVGDQRKLRKTLPT
ncbi:MAG: selenocysteine-specific translation elongation factor [Desulfovibrionaceae bacterium]|nr:selenocysteine-specific translation elongation factor [Desulfovibrionaceae bacterium]